MAELQELTNSMRSKWNSCHRAFKFSYVDLKRPAVKSEALTFGSAFHQFLENWWKCRDLGIALGAVDAKNLPGIYDFKTLEALAVGYLKRWGGEDEGKYETLDVERRFDIPLVNPTTEGVSRTFKLSGKVDGIIREKETGKILLLEHKTTSQDIGPGSDYWLKLPIDGQVSGYYLGAKQFGYEIENCLYDVIRKPTIKPFKATPEEKRKYKKDGTIYADQHEFDETVDEWFERLSADIAERPDFYYARIEVARSETDLEDYLYDMWGVAREIADAANSGRYSRNPNGCKNFGTCEYFDVCTGCASIDDDNLFITETETNPELNN